MSFHQTLARLFIWTLCAVCILHKILCTPTDNICHRHRPLLRCCAAAFAACIAAADTLLPRRHVMILIHQPTDLLNVVGGSVCFPCTNHNEYSIPMSADCWSIHGLVEIEIDIVYIYVSSCNVWLAAEESLIRHWKYEMGWKGTSFV